MEKGSGTHMDNALAFVPSGANLLEAVRGELNGDGIEYQLLVIDQPTIGKARGMRRPSAGLVGYVHQIAQAFDPHLAHGVVGQNKLARRQLGIDGVAGPSAWATDISTIAEMLMGRIGSGNLSKCFGHG